MKFSEALEECMEGKKIRNMDWNGTSAYVYYVKPHKVPIGKWVPGASDAEKERGYVEVLGHFDMLTASGKRLIGWLASQADMQSDQWEIYETEKEREKRLKEAKKLLNELEKDGFFDKEE